MPIDSIDKMFDEQNVKKFLKEYNALVKKYGLALQPTINPGFQVVKITPQQQATQPEEPK
jgi:hypothetical protein